MKRCLKTCAECTYSDHFVHAQSNIQDPVVQSFFSLTSPLRVISLTVLADLIHSILIFFAEKFCYSHFFSKKLQHICVSLNVNLKKKLLTNDVFSFEQLGPGLCSLFIHSVVSNGSVSKQ